MSNKLPPAVVANIAKDVYAITDQPSIEIAVALLRSRYGDKVELSSEEAFTGKTGGPSGLFKTTVGFGFALIGKGTLEGHAFFVFRGTRNLADWLTNLNIGVSKSVHGTSVHQGFNTAFNTMIPQIRATVDNLAKNNIHTVHCIGHSLGGALATLMAEHIIESTQFKPYLYTFGAPRIGLDPFVKMFTQRIGAERIFRAYHRTDIVPCIPFWPFVHLPAGNQHNDYFLPSPGVIPGGEYHSMDLYIHSVGKKSWGALSNYRDIPREEIAVERWLNHKSPVAFTMSNIEWVDKAISYVVGKCISAAAISLSLVAGTALTIMDKLAMILEKGLSVTGQVSGLVFQLISKIMSMIGLGHVADQAKMTEAFIRKVFERLSQKVIDIVKPAIDSALMFKM